MADGMGLTESSGTERKMYIDRSGEAVRGDVEE